MKEFVHVGYTDEDGNEIPSVTQLIGLIGSDALTKWANSLGLRRIKLDDYLDEVSTAGSLTHERIEKFLKGESVYEENEYYGKKIEEIAEKAFSHFREWEKAAQVKPIWIEKRLSNNRYGGTIDLLAEIRQGPIILIDFKTSKHPKPSHLMQLAGYLNLIKEVEPEKFKKIDFAQIVALGGLRVHTFTRPIDEMEIYMDAFEKIYMMYKAYQSCIEKDKWKDLSWK
jgi:hypothetical protein